MSVTPSGSPAVNHAASILRYVADQPHPQGLTAIARAVSVSPSSCLNILRALVSEKFLIFDQTDKSYSLGSALIVLARHALDPDNTLSLARDSLSKLAKQFDVTAGLWRVTHDKRLTLIGFEMSETNMRLHMTMGQRVPYLVGAAGRSVVALSDLPASKLRPMFDAINWADALTFEQYLAEIKFAQASGYAVDHGTFRRGVTSVAAAICDERKVPQYSVSTSMLGVHHDAKQLGNIGAAVVTAAKRIRRELYRVTQRKSGVSQ